MEDGGLEQWLKPTDLGNPQPAIRNPQADAAGPGGLFVGPCKPKPYQGTFSDLDTRGLEEKNAKDSVEGQYLNNRAQLILQDGGDSEIRPALVGKRDRSQTGHRQTRDVAAAGKTPEARGRLRPFFSVIVDGQQARCSSSAACF